MNHCTHVLEKTTDVGTGEERTVYFIYGGVPGGGGWQLLEEWEDVPSVGPALAAMFVHSGLYIDDVVQMRRWNEGEEAFEDFYYHSDDLSSVRALSDSGGELVELYDYHEFGLPTITDPNTIVNGRPALLASSAFGNPFLFTGRMYGAETRLYHYRTRPYEPRMGRFISIDSIGVWGDGANLGNGYAYVGNRPGEWADPWGLASSIATPTGGVNAYISMLTTSGMSFNQAIAFAARIWGIGVVSAVTTFSEEKIRLIIAQQGPLFIPVPMPDGTTGQLPADAVEAAVAEAAALAGATAQVGGRIFCKWAEKLVGKRCKDKPRSCIADKMPKNAPCEEYKDRERLNIGCAAARFAFSSICRGGPDEKHWQKIGEALSAAITCRKGYDDCRKTRERDASNPQSVSGSGCP